MVDGARVGPEHANRPIPDLPAVAIRAVEEIPAPAFADTGDVRQHVDGARREEQPSRRHGSAPGKLEREADRNLDHLVLDQVDPVAAHFCPAGFEEGGGAHPVAGQEALHVRRGGVSRRAGVDDRDAAPRTAENERGTEAGCPAPDHHDVVCVGFHDVDRARKRRPAQGRAVTLALVAARIGTVVLRNGVEIADPLGVLLGYLDTRWAFDVEDASGPAAFGEPDLRLANRGGARISAVEIAAILERRRAIERALRVIAPDASLAAARSAVPWQSLRRLFDAFADVRGVGCSKMTKALHRKRPALIPMLDSVVQRHLEADDLGAHAAFGERALALVRGYKRDVDANRAPLRAVRRELAKRDRPLSEVRILDLLIWSVDVPA